MTVDVVAHQNGTELGRTWALNEAIVEKMNWARLLDIVLEVDGRPVSEFACDGVLCATPTGSTAYAFSAGGPVVWPEVQAMLLVPSNAHALFARPLVISPESRVALEVSGRGDAGVLVCDGRRTIELPPGSRVEVARGRNPVLLARLRVPAVHRPAGPQVRAPGAGLARPDALSVGPTSGSVDRRTPTVRPCVRSDRRVRPRGVGGPGYREARARRAEDPGPRGHRGRDPRSAPRPHRGHRGDRGREDDGGHRVAPPGRWPRGLVARPSRRRAGDGGGALPAAHPGRGGRRGRERVGVGGRRRRAPLRGPARHRRGRRARRRRQPDRRAHRLGRRPLAGAPRRSLGADGRALRRHRRRARRARPARGAAPPARLRAARRARPLRRRRRRRAAGGATAARGRRGARRPPS